MATTLKTPFRIDGGSVATTTDYTAQIEQKIIDVLVTNKLERPALPEYGGGIMAMVFEDLESLEAADFRNDLSQEIARSITGVVLKGLDINIVDGYAEVSVVYATPLSSPRTFTFRLTDQGDLLEDTVLP